MATIPRDLGHPFNAADPNENIMMLQHGIAQPTSLAILDPNNTKNLEIPPGKLLNEAPEPNDRRLTMLSPAFRATLAARPASIDDVLPTPDDIPAADRSFFRQNVHGDMLPVPYPTKSGATTLEVWGFNDGTGPFFPGTTLRVREGELVHTTLSTRFGPHTIHHHGVEPTPMNDGVGHSTFLVSGGGYKYQWIAPPSGTYFYHCHKNTVLHFEMGMYGMLISDPDVLGAPYADGGPGRIYRGNSTVGYDREYFWVVDDFDSRWHEDVIAQGHNVGIGGGDIGAFGEFRTIAQNAGILLNRFDPDFFHVSGVIADPASPTIPNLITNPAVSPVVTRGEDVLFRILNGSYTVLTVKFPPTMDPEVLAMDGRTFGRAPYMSYSSPFRLSTINRQFTLSTAQRWDVLLDTGNVPAGTHFVEFEYRHWVTGALLRKVTMRVVVNS